MPRTVDRLSPLPLLAPLPPRPTSNPSPTCRRSSSSATPPSRTRTKGQQGWGERLGEHFDPRDQGRQPRHRRAQQPHVHHRGPLGRRARRGQARRLRAHPVRPQRRHRPRRRKTPPRHPPRHRRRNPRHHPPPNQAARDRPHLRLVPPQIRRRRAGEGHDADPLLPDPAPAEGNGDRAAPAVHDLPPVGRGSGRAPRRSPSSTCTA